MSLFYLNPHSLPLLQSAILILTIGILVWHQNPKVFATKYFFGVCLSVSIWFFGNSAMYACRDEKLALMIYRFVSFLGVSHIVAFVYRFSVAWLYMGESRKKLGVIAQWLGLIFYILCVLTPWGITEMHHYFWGFYPQYGFINKLFLGYFFVFFLMAFHNLLLAYDRTKFPTHKRRILIVLGAFLVAFLSSVDYLPKLFIVNIYPIGFATTFIWIVIVAYGLIRYQLFSAQDIARVAQDMRLGTLGMMSASLSHEVKNPIYAMKGRAEVELEKLKQSPENKNLSVYEMQQICEGVIKQSNRVLEIVRHFSQFAKKGMESQLKIEPIDLRLIWEAVQPFVQYKIMHGNVRVKISFPPNMPRVCIDSRRMEEVFINLILNACQAMEGWASNPQIEIGAKILDKEVKVFFLDNGPGFSREQKEKIFEPFYTTKPRGMGLGLFICKQLIEEMEGSLQIETSSRQGALFCMFLKREK